MNFNMIQFNFDINGFCLLCFSVYEKVEKRKSEFTAELNRKLKEVISSVIPD